MALVASGEPTDLRPSPRPDNEEVLSSHKEIQHLRAELVEQKANSERVMEAMQELQKKCTALEKNQLYYKQGATLWRWWNVQPLRPAPPLDVGQGANTCRQSVAADVQRLRSALQAALAEAAAARSQDHSQLEEERARTQQMAADLRRVLQELEDRCKSLEEVQLSNHEVAEQLALKVLVPEFCPDPAFAEMQYSHDNRRCRYTGKDCVGCFAAVAKEGFTWGRQQFTVLIDTELLYIGVAVANTPRTGRAVYRQGVFLDCDGSVFSPDTRKRSYTTETKSFKDGSRVTMQLDFDTGTASFEVDGVHL
eukprot:EG_transcript_20961